MINVLIPFKGCPHRTPERYINLENVLSSLEIAKKNSLEEFKVILGDYNSFTDRPLRNYNLDFRKIDIEGEWFNSGVAVNKLTDECKPDDTMFILSADVVVPPNLISLLKVVKDGYAIFPICWSLNKDGSGWWRESALGILGITKSDYDKIGGYKEDIESWGGDDIEVFRRAQKAGLKLSRQKWPSLIHQWHPDHQEYKNLFYKEVPKYQS